MSSLYSKNYADKYEQNKYIWENETDKNSQAAKAAHAENERIRSITGTGPDTMDYEAFRNARANHSDYYDMAAAVSVDPRYKQESDRLYDAINDFSYNPEYDTEYQAFAKTAKRQSASAQKDAYATMTKATGGRNNSFAAAATAQVAQSYAEKINDYAQNLADKAYQRLVEKYKLAKSNEEQSNADAKAKADAYIKMGDADVKNKRAILEGERDIKKAEQEYRQKELDYQADLDNFQAQLVKNKVLNAQNEYEYQRWLEDPYYEIKDKELAKAIGQYMGYSWLKQNARDFLYSKFY